MPVVLSEALRTATVRSVREWATVGTRKGQARLSLLLMTPITQSLRMYNSKQAWNDAMLLCASANGYEEDLGVQTQFDLGTRRRAWKEAMWTTFVLWEEFDKVLETSADSEHNDSRYIARAAFAPSVVKGDEGSEPPEKKKGGKGQKSPLVHAAMLQLLLMDRIVYAARSDTSSEVVAEPLTLVEDGELIAKSSELLFPTIDWKVVVSKFCAAQDFVGVDPKAYSQAMVVDTGSGSPSDEAMISLVGQVRRNDDNTRSLNTMTMFSLCALGLRALKLVSDFADD